MLQKYFGALYRRTMTESYALARSAVADALQDGGDCLDCGATQGHEYDYLQQSIELELDRYTGIEWNAEAVAAGQANGKNIVRGDFSILAGHKYRRGDMGEIRFLAARPMNAKPVNSRDARLLGRVPWPGSGVA